MAQFLRHGLSENSRRLFAPYPYDLPDDGLARNLDEVLVCVFGCVCVCVTVS